MTLNGQFGVAPIQGLLTRRIFRDFAVTAPELDCAIIGELSRLLPRAKSDQFESEGIPIGVEF
jgi:hypothetical protein